MQDFRDEGKEGCKKGRMQERMYCMQERRYAGKEGCRKGGYRKGGVQERKDAGKEGFKR